VGKLLRIARVQANCNKGTIAVLELMTKLKIDAYRTAGGMQGRLRAALTSQETTKYVEHCVNP